jgi:2,4-dienoyl-CoA reductase-like NADH-dependent reductase (Old Yellow Enzyme family)
MSAWNGIKILLDIIEKIKVNTSKDFLIGVRISPEEKKDPTVIRYVLSDDPFNTLVIKF